jgi:hypothetical protein
LPETLFRSSWLIRQILFITVFSKDARNTT